MTTYRIKMTTGNVYEIDLEGVGEAAPIGSLRLAWEKGRGWTAREDHGTHWPLDPPRTTYINPAAVASIVKKEEG